jgi:hypothetical protein
VLHHYRDYRHLSDHKSCKSVGMGYSGTASVSSSLLKKVGIYFKILWL